MSKGYPKFNKEVLDKSIEIKIELEKLLDHKFGLLKKDIQIKETQLERTKLAIKYEKNNNYTKAIKLYEKNVSEETLSPYDYSRLAILYRKIGNYEAEVELLEKAIVIFDNRSYDMDDEEESSEE